MRILVAEDEVKLAGVLERALTGEGHAVDVVHRGDDAVRAAVAASPPFDAIVLDVMMPGLDGMAACQRMRDAGVQAWVIMLTARVAVEDRVAGLDHGADDYLAKPFALRELYARLRAAARRSEPVAGDAGAVLSCDGLRLDLGGRVAWRGDTRIDLRPKEFALLEHLMRTPGRVHSRFEILDTVWEGQVDQTSNVVDAQVRRLRAKVDEPFGTASLETVRGVGYRFRSMR